mmetsp:Transcript_25247/g.42307  ORF Transcript_25247/g.42307 Transcript_25247/m.42307 type:complete len:206 (-) Transcript_25247:2067-2684(-)
MVARFLAASAAAASMPLRSPATASFSILSESPPRVSIFSWRAATAVAGFSAAATAFARTFSAATSSLASSLRRLASSPLMSAAASNAASCWVRSPTRALSASSSASALGMAPSSWSTAFLAAAAARLASAAARRRSSKSATTSLSSKEAWSTVSLEAPADSATEGASPTRKRPVRGRPPPPDMVPDGSMSSPFSVTTRDHRLSFP